MCCQRKRHRAENRRNRRTRRHPQSIRPRSPGDKGHQRYRQHFEENRQLRPRRSRGKATQKQWSRTSPVPRFAGKMKNMIAVRTCGKGRSHNRKRNQCRRNHDEASQQRLHRRTRTAQPRIHQRYSGNRQRRQQQKSQRERERAVQKGHWRRWSHRFSLRSCMWPRTVTTRPIASTASPHKTKATRCADEGNKRIAAIERKNPAGITSNPAYFMASSLQGNSPVDRGRPWDPCPQKK